MYTVFFVNFHLVRSSYNGTSLFRKIRNELSPLRLIFVRSSTAAAVVPLGRRPAVDKFKGCSSAAEVADVFDQPNMSAMLWAVGVRGGLPYTWGCHVPATGSGDACTATAAPPDRSAVAGFLLQSIIISIACTSHGSRHAGAKTTHFTNTHNTHTHTHTKTRVSKPIKVTRPSIYIWRIEHWSHAQRSR